MLAALVVVLAVVLHLRHLAAVAAVSATSDINEPHADAPTVTLSLDMTSHLPWQSHHIPGNFMGLSLEWCNPPHFAGNSSHPHKTFTTILPYMSTRQGKGPTIRIGGSSSDRSWYNPHHHPRPPWKDFVADVDDDTFIRMDAVAEQLDLPIIAGVSFRYAYSMNITTPWVDAIHRLTGLQHWRLEIGNEQDIYDACGPHPYEDYRPCGWGWDNFTVEWDWEAEQIMSLVPPGRPLKLFQGGAFCCPWFQSHMANWTLERADHLSSFSFHRYIWNGCGDDPTLGSFLSDYAGLDGLNRPLEGNITLPGQVAAIIKGTAGTLPVYLGEGNSVGCQGMAGITDTYAQVLWLLDYCMALSSFNVSGMHFYVGWTDPQDFLATPFLYSDPQRDEVTVQATMYGMWMFALATYNHARIVAAARVDSVPDLGPLKSWTLVDRERNVVVLLVHKNYNVTDAATVNITLTLPAGADIYAANVVGLTAPSVTAKQGIALAGLSWDGTTDGRPRPTAGRSGAVAVEVAGVAVVGTGEKDTMQVTYQVQVLPVSVVLVVIPTEARAVPISWKQRVQTILQHAGSSEQATVTPA